MKGKTKPGAIRVRTVVERRYPQLPRFVVIPAELVAPWKLSETTTVEGLINATPLGRRSLKRWDEHRWWIDLPAPLCKKAGIDVDDRVTLELRIASTELPLELALLIQADARAAAAWKKLTPAQQRMLREEVATVKSSVSRASLAARRLSRVQM